MYELKVKLIKIIQSHAFVRNVLLLMTGTAGAQLITLLSSPLLTRIFSPESFGLLAIFMAVVSSALPCATGRYEIASMLPKNNKISLDLFVIGIWFSLLVCVLFFIVLELFKDQLVAWLNEPLMANWLIFAPIVFLVIGWQVSFTYMANRASNYHVISISKFVQAITMISLSIILSWIGFEFSGLLIASIIGPAAALVYIVLMHKNTLRKMDWRWTKRKTILAKKYISYPVYNAFPGVLNGITVALPVFYITNNYSLEILGYYALVMRVIYAPVSLIAASVGQVNIKMVIDLFHAKVDIEKHIYKTAFWLFLISLVPVLIFGIFGTYLFSFVFGDDWQRAGEMSQILVFALSIRFVSSSLSSAIGGTNNNHLSAIWRIIAFGSTVYILFFFGPYQSINDVLIALVLNDIVLYCLFFIFIIKAVRHPKI